MRLQHAILTALLTLSLTGGAQICMAMCAQPAKPVAVQTKPEKSCRNCGGHAKPEAGDQSPAKPAEPCQHCQKAATDRVSAERDHAVAAPLLLAILPASETVVSPADCRRTAPAISPATSPPNQRLHVVCTLLI